MNVINQVKEVELGFLEATYLPETNEVRIFASISSLKSLHHMLGKLIEKKFRGSHFHLDEINGLSGNVTSIVIRKIFQDELPKIPS